MPQDRTDGGRVRLCAGAFAAAGVLFLLYPATRPYEDETTMEGATRAMSSEAWVASHLFGMLAFTLLALAFIGIWLVLRRSGAERLAARAVVVTWVGVALALPFFGAETYGLYVIAEAADGRVDLVEVVEDFRGDPVALTTFALGLAAVAVGSVMAALAIRGSGALPANTGVVLAAGLVLYMPQFLAPGPVRIAHGALMAVGCVLLARALWTSGVAAAAAPHNEQSG